ncbi:hypothetical protein TIFTF001_027766 [Ficus carica]|uniref:Uncharacterized protein n=1 Tax=Ficus carica TaxID=3494 RepID=A0AA88DNR6_FICCA|nr:hypothetical protein TIFTF001_027766 [Ficus carica]
MSGGGLSVVTGHRCQHVRGTTCEGQPVRVNNIDPRYYLTWVHGRSRLCGKIGSDNKVPREVLPNRIESGQQYSASAEDFITFT